MVPLFLVEEDSTGSSDLLLVNEVVGLDTSSLSDFPDDSSIVVLANATNVGCCLLSQKPLNNGK